jgi:phosphate transport system permease protein
MPIDTEPPAAAARRPRRARFGGAVAVDRVAERGLRALAALTLVLIGAMVVTVFVKAWPSFRANGLSWFGSGGEVDAQLRAMAEGQALPGHSILYIRTWPLIWGTIVTTVPAVIIALVGSTLAAICLTEFASPSVRRTLEPLVRLLAGVPSVVYGLVGVLLLGPFINDHLISEARRRSVQYVVQLEGDNLMLAIIILAIMITPIMVALIATALASVPQEWKEGSAALGVNRWRTIVRVSLRTARPAIAAATVLATALASVPQEWKEGSAALGVNRWRTIVRVSLRTARPAIAAATVLATARALGEAIMLAMVAGSRGFAANPLDGLTFLFEPVRPLAATIFQEAEGLSIGPTSHTLYAMGAVLLVSATLLSFAGWAAKEPLKRYGIRA